MSASNPGQESEHNESRKRSEAKAKPINVVPDDSPSPAEAVSEGAAKVPICKEEWQMLLQEIGRFFERNPPPLARETEDLIQDALRRAVRAFANMPRACATARLGYALQIAKHVRVDAFRCFRTRRVRYESDLQQAAWSSRDEDDKVLFGEPKSKDEGNLDEPRDVLRQLLVRNLDATTVDLFLLTRWDGFTLDEAAEPLGLTRPEAEAARRRILRFLSAPGRRERLLNQLGLPPGAGRRDSWGPRPEPKPSPKPDRRD